MNIDLVKLSGFAEELGVVRKMRAVCFEERSPINAKLLEWSISEKADYNKVMASLAYAGTTYLPYLDRKKVARDDAGETPDRACAATKCPIYEARAAKGSARIFFYHSPGPVAVAVCVHWMWKVASSRREQEREFETARRIRNTVFDPIEIRIRELLRKGDL